MSYIFGKSPIEIVLVAYKSKSPLFIHIYQFFREFFREYFPTSIWRNLFKNPSCTHLAYRVHPRRDLTVESWR